MTPSYDKWLFMSKPLFFEQLRAEKEKHKTRLRLSSKDKKGSSSGNSPEEKGWSFMHSIFLYSILEYILPFNDFVLVEESID